MRHRYVLGREWDVTKPRAMFILLNPSVADSDIDDPTCRRGIGFSERLGFGGMVFCNLFAFVATNPSVLRAKHARIGITGWQEEEEDLEGPRNDEYIKREAKGANTIIAAWGAHETWGRDEDVECLLGDRELKCLGKTKGGAPRHILYLPYSANLMPFAVEESDVY